MSLFFLSTLTWGVTVYCLWICLRGNPAYHLLANTPLPVLRHAAECLNPEKPQQPDDQQTSVVLSQFIRISLLFGLIFGAEMALSLYYLYQFPGPFSGFLAIKNLVVIGLAWKLQRRSDSNPIFAALGLPNWAIRWERVSHGVSGICLLVLLLRLHEIL